MRANLTSEDCRALQEFAAFLRGSFPEQIEFVALFGSKARGEGQEDSDIDVLVILKREDRELRRVILRQAAHLSLKYDVVLSPRVIGAERWEQMRGFSLYRNVQRESARLEMSGGSLVVEAS